MPKKKFTCGLFAALLVLSLGGGAHAETAGKYSHLYLESNFGSRYIPPGFGETVEMHYRYYYSGSDSILFKNNHVGVGVVDSVSPATNDVGAFIEIEPVAVFRLRMEYLYRTFFGEFTALLPFPDKDADFSESVLEEREENDEAVWEYGHTYKIQPTFQMQYERFILMNDTSFVWYDIDRDGYFYEPVNDTLMKTEDYFFLNSTIVGVETWRKTDRKRIIAGSRYSFFRVDSTGIERQQLDGVMVWMMGEKLAFLENPMLMLAVGGYLEDKYHEKDAFAGLMFKFEYSLMKSAAGE